MKKSASKYVKKNQSLRITIVIIAVLLLILAVSVGFSVFEMQKKRMEEIEKQNWLSATILTIDGTPVSVREYNIFLDDAMSETSRFLSDKYKSNPQILYGLWGKAYDGIVPFDYAKELAIKNLLPYIAEKIEAKKLGQSKDISYSAFLKRLVAENATRKEKLARGEKIIGTTEVREREYYFKLHKELVQKLKDYLSQNQFVVSNANLVNFYKKNINKYSKGTYIKDERIYIKFTDEIGIPDKQLIEKARITAETVLKKIKANIPFDAIIKDYQGIEGISVTIHKDVFDENTVTKQLMYVYDTAKKLKIGQSSDVITMYGGLNDDIVGFNVIRVIENKNLGNSKYEDIVKEVRTDYIESEYTEYKTKIMMSLTVKKELNIFQKVKINKNGNIEIEN